MSRRDSGTGDVTTVIRVASVRRVWRHPDCRDSLIQVMRNPTLTMILRVLSVSVLLCGAGAAQAQTGHPQRGRALAAANCSGCHAINRTGTSPLAAAPAFRDIHRRYPVSQLAEALAEGIVTGHSAMPEFQMTRAQIADFLAYLRTLQR